MRILQMAAAERFREDSEVPQQLGNLVAVGGTTIRIFNAGTVEDHIPDVSQVWTDVVVANGKICAVSYEGKKIAVKDLVGGSWQVMFPGTAINTNWRGVTAVGNRFFMYGFSASNNEKLVSTEDFITWTYHALTDSSNENYNKLSNYNGKVLVPIRAINNVMAMDAITGVQTKYPIDYGGYSFFPYAFKVVNDKAFALGQGRKVSVASITNGVINADFDMKIGVNESSHARDIEYLDEIGMYVVVGSFGSGFGTSPLVYTSPDAEKFTVMPNVSILFGSSNAFQSVAKHAGALYMGSNDGRIFKTTDMMNFEVFSTMPGRVDNIKTFD